MAKSEKSILNETLVAVTALPETMAWRNNTGSAWQGKRVTGSVGTLVMLEPGMVILREARPVTFGLPGSPDIIGVRRQRAIGAEIKSDDGVQADLQIRFQRAWEKAGGLYVLARSADEVVEVLIRGC